MPTRRPAVVLGLLSLLLVLVPVLSPVGAQAAKPRTPSVSIGDVTVTETDAAGVVATFTLTLTKGTGKKVKVDWATKDGTATAGTDYTAASGRVVFSGPATRQTRTIQVTITGDDVVEPDETFTVALTKVKGGKAKRSAAAATIRNDDAATSAAPTTRHTLTVAKAGTGTGTVTSTPAGIACGSDCTEQYASGTTVTLTAAATASSDFAGWSGGGCSGSTPTCVLTLADAAAVTATFTTANRTLTVARTGTGTGTVTSGPSGISCPGSCAEAFEHGTTVVLTATPAPDSDFAGWSGDCTGTDLLCTVTLTAARTVTAQFTAVSRSMSVIAPSAGSGRVVSTPAGMDCGATCSVSVPKSSVLVLTAEPAPGYRFTGWEGACTEALTAVCQLTMLDDGTSRAVFEAIPAFTLSLTFAGSGAGSVGSEPAGISCTTTCGHGFAEGAVVQLTAVPEAASVFTGWGGACSGSGACSVTLDVARSVTATFTKERTLTVGRGGAGAGAVTSAPAGIDCGTDCDEVYLDGTSVVLTAAPVTNSVFTGWSGGGCFGTGTCTVSMTSATSVSAVFSPLTYTLAVTKEGAGAGTISGTVPNVNCLPGSPCTVQVEHDQVVTLNAAAGTNSRFTGWSGDCTGLGSCTVTMGQARSVTATFAQQFTLTVNRSGTGTGSVAASPAGIACPATCSATYAGGTEVTLTPSASPGHVFTGWSGACQDSEPTCTVTMSQARSVTARFAIAQHQLTVAVDGSGSGIVTSGGIFCPSMCTRSYDHGTSVTLYTSVDKGSFTGWGGACSGQASTCQVTMDQARTVTATFSLPTHQLSVAKSGSGAADGQVTSDVAGISCGSDCSESYTQGATVTLTASTGAFSGLHFQGWSGGGCSGADPCTVTMSQARSVTAEFGYQNRVLALERTGPTSSSVLSDQVSGCSGPSPSCLYFLGHGTFVELRAGPGATFLGWSGCDVVTAQNRCQVTVTSDRSVTANFS